MATYRIKGGRFLRKYTEPQTSPTYAAAIEAQTVVRAFCDVPWEKVAEDAAQMTYHTSESVETGEVDAEGKPVTLPGLDMNVRIRDKFDAALFCAGHTGGQHRAYANAAVYRYALPDTTDSHTLTSLALNVTSDPYNSQGVRIHVFTNDTGVIPTDCHELRGEDSSGEIEVNSKTASAVVKRTVRTEGGEDFWYPTNETVTISPTGGLTLQKYLFIYVGLESYSTVRGNWLEGSSFIANDVSMTLAENYTGLDADELNDLSASAEDMVEFPVVSGGVLPYAPDGTPTGERHVVVRADSNPVAEADGRQMPTSAAPGAKAASALSRAYAAFYTGEGETPAADGFAERRGASFNVVRSAEMLPDSGGDEPTETDLIHIDSTALVVPFAWPRGVAPSKIRLEFAEPSLPDGARFNVFLANGYLLSLAEEQLKNPGMYDGGDGAPFKLLGTIEGGTSAEFDAPSGAGRMGTLVISAWMPPEAYDLAEGGSQGTGATGFLPDISIIAER